MLAPQRRATASLDDRPDPVGHPRIRDYDHGNVILIALRRGQADELGQEIDGRRRPHAA
jgi:hypothetical protein